MKKNGVVKEAIVLQWAVRIASQWHDFKPGKKRWASALLSEKCCCFVRKHRERFTQIWTSPSEEEKEEEEEDFGRLVTFWFGTFAMLVSATGCVFRHENTRRWKVGCYNGLWVSCFGDFEKFVCISIYCVSALSLHIESTDSMIVSCPDPTFSMCCGLSEPFATAGIPSYIHILY